MAEFKKVLEQWCRMCERHTCDNRDGIGQALPLCPLCAKHTGYPCDDPITDLSPESAALVEKIVMQWAAENPETVYPTWGEWLRENGILKGDKASRFWIDFDAHIPADIAEKLGLKPRRAK